MTSRSNRKPCTSSRNIGYSSSRASAALRCCVQVLLLHGCSNGGLQYQMQPQEHLAVYFCSPSHCLSLLQRQQRGGDGFCGVSASRGRNPAVAPPKDCFCCCDRLRCCCCSNCSRDVSSGTTRRVSTSPATSRLSAAGATATCRQKQQ